MQYTVEGLKAMGYRGYIRDKTGEVRESDEALTLVAVMANFNRWYLIFEPIKDGRKRISLRDGLYTMDGDMWIEKEVQ